MSERLEAWLEPGQGWQRAAALCLLPLAGLAVARWWGGELHGALAIVAGIAAFFFTVFSFERLFRAWTAFGERANRVVVGAIFFAIYAVFVPIFSLIRLKDRFGLRGGSRRPSFWVERRQPDDSIESMLRMG